VVVDMGGKQSSETPLVNGHMTRSKHSSPPLQVNIILVSHFILFFLTGEVSKKFKFVVSLCIFL
jgi:hypothetical protein